MRGIRLIPSKIDLWSVGRDSAYLPPHPREDGSTKKNTHPSFPPVISLNFNSTANTNYSAKTRPYLPQDNLYLPYLLFYYVCRRGDMADLGV